jgi:hypothetical protein
MTPRREAPAVQFGLVVVIFTLAFTVALVGENLRTDGRLIASDGPPYELRRVKSRYLFCRVARASRRSGF